MESDIERVEKEIQAAEAKAAEYEEKKDQKNMDYWREKEKALREKEKALHEEKNLLLQLSLGLFVCLSFFSSLPHFFLFRLALCCFLH